MISDIATQSMMQIRAQMNPHILLNDEVAFECDEFAS